MMNANLPILNQQGSFNSWLLVLQQLDRVIERVQSDRDSAILTLWANRGGGKTTCLRWLAETLAEREAMAVLGIWTSETSTLEDATLQISTALASAPDDRVKVVLFDDVDLLLSDNAEQFFHFEREVVLPLIDRGNCILVNTSRSVIRQWEEYEVRDRHTNWPIPVLDNNDLGALAARWGLPLDRLRTATLGYPQAVSWLHDQPTLTDDELADRILTHFFGGLPEMVIKLARAVCLLPMFNAAILWQILAEDKPTVDSLYADVLDRLREMIGAGLVFWDAPSGMYRFSSGAVWRLLSHSRWQIHDVEVRRVHEAAANYFKLEARRLAYLPYSLIGALYHLGSVSRFDGTLTAGEAALRWLGENFRLWNGADWSRVWTVWESGAGNPNLVEELNSLFGPEAYQAISTQLKQAALPLEA